MSYINIKEIFKFRDLIFLFVKRDFVVFYKQTVLGPLWYIIQPLFNTIVFTFIFGKVARIPTDGIPPFLFYLSGTVVWGYFSICLGQTGKTFVTNAGVFGKVYFPRITVPISNGKLELGTWQGIYLCEHRNLSHTRCIIATLNGENY